MQKSKEEGGQEGNNRRKVAKKDLPFGMWRLGKARRKRENIGKEMSLSLPLKLFQHNKQGQLAKRPSSRETVTASYEKP